MNITYFEERHWPETWGILKPIFREGESCVVERNLSAREAYQRWIELPEAAYVALEDDRVVGAFYLKTNHFGGGSHVCNGDFVVAERFRNQGIAEAMTRKAQAEAKIRGYLAMQLNFVVSTNKPAVNLGRKVEFQIVGTLPKAFLSPSYGLVDAFVMYKWLADDNKIIEGRSDE